MPRRQFNTAGPCQPDIHYMLPPERRLGDIRGIIAGRGYFSLTAPRQVGKTTALRALAAALTSEGSHAAILVSVEEGSLVRSVGAAENAILSSWRLSAGEQLPADVQPPPWPDAAEGTRVRAALSAWAHAVSRPLVVFIDEIDALQDDVLLSILRQIRAGHPSRPQHFPVSIALIGMRDVRDYKVASGGGDRLGTSSPFNIKVASLTMRPFTAEEVAELYQQHTVETGQAFDAKAMALAYDLSRGHPWLVNALAAEAVSQVPAPQRIDEADIDRARRALIARRDTHLDSLAERLREPRVQRIIEPILAGGVLPSVVPDDLAYVLDLGLVAPLPDGSFAIANPIYAEIIPSVLAATTRATLPATQPTWRRPEGTLDVDRLLEAFLAFWRQHGQPLLASAPYHEVAPHLVFLAFLDRVANGGGSVTREYAIGSGRLDILLEYGPPGQRERFAFELKVHRDGRPDPRTEGLTQLDAYLARAGLETGWLVIFDRRTAIPPLEERVSVEEGVTASGRRVHVVRG